MAEKLGVFSPEQEQRIREIVQEERGKGGFDIEAILKGARAGRFAESLPDTLRGAGKTAE